MSKPKLKMIAPPQTTFKIEKGIPIAPIRSGGSGKPNPLWPVLAAMKPGDSFIVGKRDKDYHRVAGVARKWGKENNATFVFRNTPDGYRAWKIK